jgi:hypothetical protein
MRKFFESSLRPTSVNKYLVAKEVGFKIETANSAYPEYSAFDDVHMRTYWCQPVVKQKLMNLGLVSQDGRRLIDPDKERMRLKSAQSRIARAEIQNQILYQKRISKLLIERAWLKRQMVDVLKNESVARQRHSCV